MPHLRGLFVGCAAASQRGEISGVGLLTWDLPGSKHCPALFGLIWPGHIGQYRCPMGSCFASNQACKVATLL